MAVHYVDPSKQNALRTLSLLAATVVLFCVVGVTVFNTNDAEPIALQSQELDSDEAISSDPTYDTHHKTLSTHEIDNDEMHDIQERFARYASHDMTGDLEVASTKALQRVIRECRTEVSRDFMQQLMRLKIKTDDHYDNIKALSRHLRDEALKAYEDVIPARGPQDESMAASARGTQMLASSDVEATEDDEEKEEKANLAANIKQFDNTVTDSTKVITQRDSDADLQQAAAMVQMKVSAAFLADLKKSEDIIDEAFSDARKAVLKMGKISFIGEKYSPVNKKPELDGLGFSASENTLEEQRRNFVEAIKKENRPLLEENTKLVVHNAYAEVKHKMAVEFDQIIASLKVKVANRINDDLVALYRLYDNQPPSDEASSLKKKQAAPAKAPAKAAAGPAKAPAKGKAPAKAPGKAPAKAGTKMQLNTHSTLAQNVVNAEEDKLAQVVEHQIRLKQQQAEKKSLKASNFGQTLFQTQALATGDGKTNHEADLGTVVHDNSEPVIKEAAAEAIDDVEKATREKTVLRLQAALLDIKRQVNLLMLHVEQATLAEEGDPDHVSKGDYSAAASTHASTHVVAASVLFALFALVRE